MKDSASDQKQEAKKVSKQRTSQGTSEENLYETDTNRFAVTIGKPVAEVFQFWRDFRNLPLFMKDLKNITMESEKKSTWTVQTSQGLEASWQAEIVAEKNNQLIAWESLEGSEVETHGVAWFKPAPAGKGTIVSFDLGYSVPGGKLTEIIAQMMGESPDLLIKINLRRFKALMETGEVPTTQGQSSGRDEGYDKNPGHAEAIKH